jgi:hypothetical protein
LIDQEIAACQKFLHALEERRNGSYSIRDPATFEQVVLASRIYQTQALLVWLRELQTECVGMH